MMVSAQKRERLGKRERKRESKQAREKERERLPCVRTSGRSAASSTRCRPPWWRLLCFCLIYSAEESARETAWSSAKPMDSKQAEQVLGITEKTQLHKAWRKSLNSNIIRNVIFSNNNNKSNTSNHNWHKFTSKDNRSAQDNKLVNYVCVSFLFFLLLFLAELFL